MTKIAVAGGHSYKAQGASGYLNEYEKDRAIVAKLVPALEAAGYEVVDCSNEQPTVNGELKEEVAAANQSGADLFIAIHFNAGGGTGTECWYYTGNGQGYAVAANLSENVANVLGLRNRGAKATTGLYVLRHTNMPAVLLEVCFVDTYRDAQAWWNTAWNPFIDAIVKAIQGVNVPSNSGNETHIPPTHAETPDLTVDGFWGSATVKACQKALGTVQDGVVSGQDYRDMNAIGGKPTGAWNIGTGGSLMIQELQVKLGVEADGYFGPNTLKALQSKMGTEVDGKLSRPSACVKEMQRRLNTGTFLQ